MSLTARKNSFAPLTDVKAKQQRGHYGNNEAVKNNKGGMSWHQKLRGEIRHKFNMPHPGRASTGNANKYATLDSDNATGGNNSGNDEAKNDDLSVISLSQNGLIKQLDSLVVFPRIDGKGTKNLSKSAKDLTGNASFNSSELNTTHKADSFLNNNGHLTLSKSFGKAKSSFDISNASSFFGDPCETETSQADFFACFDKTRRASEIITSGQADSRSVEQKRRSTIADPFVVSHASYEIDYFSSKNEDLKFFDSFTDVAPQEKGSFDSFNEKETFKADFPFSFAEENPAISVERKMKKKDLFKTFSSPGKLLPEKSSYFSKDVKRNDGLMIDDPFQMPSSPHSTFLNFEERSFISSGTELKNKALQSAFHDTMVTPTQIIVKSMDTTDDFNNMTTDNQNKEKWNDFTDTTNSDMFYDRNPYESHKSPCNAFNDSM